MRAALSMRVVDLHNASIMSGCQTENRSELSRESALIAKAIFLGEGRDRFPGVSQVSGSSMDTGAQDELPWTHFDQLGKLTMQLSFRNSDLACKRGDPMIGGGGAADHVDNPFGCGMPPVRGASTRIASGDANDSERFTFLIENRILACGKPLKSSCFVKKNLSMVDERLASCHELTISLDQLVCDLSRITIMIGGADNL